MYQTALKVEKGELERKLDVLSRDIEPWLISASALSVMMCEVYEEAWLAFANKHGLMYLRGTRGAARQRPPGCPARAGRPASTRLSEIR